MAKYNMADINGYLGQGYNRPNTNGQMADFNGYPAGRQPSKYQWLKKHGEFHPEQGDNRPNSND